MLVLVELELLPLEGDAPDPASVDTTLVPTPVDAVVAIGRGGTRISSPGRGVRPGAGGAEEDEPEPEDAPESPTIEVVMLRMAVASATVAALFEDGIFKMKFRK